jgi:hypothetical protein
MPEQTNITISYVELSNTDQSVLKVSISLLEKNGMSFQLLNEGDANGAVTVIDLDTTVGRAFYDQFTPSRGKTVLLLSNETLDNQRNVVLRKPIRVQTLKDTLYDLCVEVTPALRTAATSSRKSEMVTEASKDFDSSQSLFNILLKAKQEKQIVQIFCPPHSPIYVDCSRKLVATSASRQTLQKIILDRSGQIKSTKLSSSDFDILAKGQMIMPLNNLLWMSAMFSSYGELVAGTTPDTLVQLKAWPNLSRLEFNPDHMKLASAMTTWAMSLKQIEQKTKISWDTIVNFYNAAWATDLVVLEPIGVTKTVKARGKSEIKGNLLNKIAQRLKIAS